MWPPLPCARAGRKSIVARDAENATAIKTKANENRRMDIVSPLGEVGAHQDLRRGRVAAIDRFCEQRDFGYVHDGPDCI
jgi:hypothetical protein